MKALVYFQSYSLLFLFHSRYAAAWPAWFPQMGSIIARQDIGNGGNAPAPLNSGNLQPMPTNAGDGKPTGTLSMPAIKSSTETLKPSDSGNQSGSQTVSQSTSYDARLPAGGIAMMTPAVSLGQQYFKIGDHVTFGWNYTSLEAVPTAVNVMATCTANKQLYTIQMNQTVANNTGSVVWDTGSYQATAVQDPLLTQTYTLIIYDSDSSISATAQPGYLAVFSQYTFGLYSPKPNTLLGDFKCVTCNGGLTNIQKNALGMVFAMSMITVLSFTWFMGGVGIIW